MNLPWFGQSTIVRMPWPWRSVIVPLSDLQDLGITGRSQRPSAVPTVLAMSTTGSYRESLARHCPNEALHLGLVVVVVQAGHTGRVRSERRYVERHDGLLVSSWCVVTGPAGQDRDAARRLRCARACSGHAYFVDAR